MFRLFHRQMVKMPRFIDQRQTRGPRRGIPCGALVVFGGYGERQYLCNRRKEFHDKQDNLLINLKERRKTMSVGKNFYAANAVKEFYTIFSDALQKL